MTAYMAPGNSLILKPMFKNINLLGRENFIASEVKRVIAAALCPVAEDLQPRLMQFKTSYWNPSDADQQAQILHNTIRSLN